MTNTLKNICLFLLSFTATALFACNSQKNASSNTGNAEITETYWRLTELNGKVVGPTPADKKEVHIKLRKQDNQLQGFAGCNGFGGRYELKEGGQISFSNIMGTMMACDDLANENKLFEALRETDNYIHHGKSLLLNKGKKAPLARFEAVYFK
ncbi:MAG: META domain-containing protein [Chitinophagaceae bacterium]